MPRLPRIYLEDVLYYITARGNHEQEIFKEEEDYRLFLELLKKYKEHYHFKLYAYVLLPNHFHLLLELASQGEEGYQGGLSEIMHDLNSSYTKYFNGKYEREGHLFSGRYRATLTEKEPYLLKLTAYIHLNPKRLNLVLSPEDYPYSSYILYLNKEAPVSDVIKEEKNEVISLCAGNEYNRFVKELTKDEEVSLHNYLKRAILGSKEFEERVRQTFPLYQKKKIKELPSPKKLGIISLIIFSLGLGAIFTLKLSSLRKIDKKAPFLLDQRLIHEIRGLLEDLESTEWQIRIFPGRGGEVQSDTIRFYEGKFTSSYLSAKGYTPSNYSLVILNESIVSWETAQVSTEGRALWKGEVKGRDMQGVLTMQYVDGKTQDFSFISVGGGEGRE